MKIVLPKVQNVEFYDIKYLYDSIVRFKIRNINQDTIQFYKELLGEVSITEKNKQQISWIQEELKNEFLKSREEFLLSEEGSKTLLGRIKLKWDKKNKKVSKVAIDPKINDYIDLLKNKIEHILNPEYIYFNGQKVITIFKRNLKYEIEMHDNYFSHFNTRLADIKLDIYDKETFPSILVAEKTIIHLLNSININNYIAVKESNEKNLALQFCKGYAIGIFEKQEFLAEYYNEDFPYFIEKYLKGYKVVCCENCTYFSRSGMDWDMMDGECGYCAHAKVGSASARVCRSHYCNDFKINPSSVVKDSRLLNK